MNDTVLEQHSFGAEVGRLLDLVVHSLYSEREIFLRELVANAADAVDRRRFESLTDANLAPPADAKIRIIPDKQASSLLISDDGIGMTRQEMIDNLGTIARSGTRAFAQNLASAKPEDRPSLIGQFGVGFYSAFMVADRVEVTSRKAGSEEAFTWASEGAGEFTLGPATREQAGTDVVLHIKSDASEYLEPVRLETVIRKWADHITLPITVARDGKDQPANEGTALWRKAKSETTEQSYKEFYRHLGHFFDDPWATLHWRAEGTLEYFCLLFIPGMKPFDPVEGDRDAHIRLHVRRMFITDKAELLPHWLRFVSGVVDTEDLPLNVSREMLQTTPVLARIRKALIGRVMSELKTRTKEAEDYNKFFENFGPILKEGVWEDAEYRAEIAPLLRFASSTQEGLTSLPDYVSRMPEGQDTIYYLVRRQGRGAEDLAAVGRLPGEGLGSVADVRSDRCVLAGTVGQLRGEEAAQRHPVSRGPGQGRRPAGYLQPAGRDEDGARGPRGRRPLHRSADRQRGGPGPQRSRAGSGDAAADASRRTSDDAGETRAGGQSAA